MTAWDTHLAVLPAGSGCRAVVEHLAEVRNSAVTDLIRAPQAQRFLLATLDYWCDTAVGPLRRELDRMPVDAASGFCRQPPPPSVTGISKADTLQQLAVLQAHGWLEPALNTGARTLYRCQVGTPFGVTARR